MINISEITANNDFTILVKFDNHEEKIFDLKPYLEKDVFQEMKDINYFRQMRNMGYFIEWPHEQDISADTLYYEGKNTEVYSK